ncbi:MAG TPA: hypothetical protein VKD46_01400 [bacterium]|nr:hypothetical protein [bacterium]
MPRKHISVHEQVDLFWPGPNRPVWKELPDGVRNEVCALLVQLLQADAGSCPRTLVGEGATDE